MEIKSENFYVAESGVRKKEHLFDKLEEFEMTGVQCPVRLVARKLNARIKKALPSHVVYAMLPWETVKALLGVLVTDGITKFYVELELNTFDVGRAHFTGYHHILVELPGYLSLG